MYLHVLKFYLLLLMWYFMIPLQRFGLCFWSISLFCLICVTRLPLWLFGSCFWTILLCLSYNDSCLRFYYDSMMNTFESEYPFGDFLEDSNFDELSEFLQFHCQKTNLSILWKRVTSLCKITYFVVGGRQKFCILSLVIFSLPYIMTWYVETLFPTGS